MTIQEKLLYLTKTKSLIREAIKAKGVNITSHDTFRSYADKIAEISTSDAPPTETSSVDVTSIRAIRQLDDLAYIDINDTHYFVNCRAGIYKQTTLTIGDNTGFAYADDGYIFYNYDEPRTRITKVKYGTYSTQTLLTVPAGYFVRDVGFNGHIILLYKDDETTSTREFVIYALKSGKFFAIYNQTGQLAYDDFYYAFNEEDSEYIVTFTETLESFERVQTYVSINKDTAEVTILDSLPEHNSSSSDAVLESGSASYTDPKGNQDTIDWQLVDRDTAYIIKINDVEAQFENMSAKQGYKYMTATSYFDSKYNSDIIKFEMTSSTTTSTLYYVVLQGYFIQL